MANITMSLDEKLIRKIRKIALERGTSVTGMVRSYLIEVAQREDAEKQGAIRKLRGIYEKSGITVGSKTWTREELHERR
jgi:hypothetical protein